LKRVDKAGFESRGTGRSIEPCVWFQMFVTIRKARRWTRRESNSRHVSLTPTAGPSRAQLNLIALPHKDSSLATGLCETNLFGVERPALRRFNAGLLHSR